MHSSSGWMLQPSADGTGFNAYRVIALPLYKLSTLLEWTPREPHLETENKGTHITQQKKTWRQKTEEDIKRTTVLVALFKKAIHKAMWTTL